MDFLTGSKQYLSGRPQSSFGKGAGDIAGEKTYPE
jgi:hypothetical protein